jgi:hypothetical protein
MSANSITLPRGPRSFKRRKYSKVKRLRPRVFDKPSLPKLVSVLYWSVDAEGVTRITHRLCHLSVLRMDEPASQHCKQLIRP